LILIPIRTWETFALTSDSSSGFCLEQNLSRTPLHPRRSCSAVGAPAKLPQCARLGVEVSPALHSRQPQPLLLSLYWHVHLSREGQAQWEATLFPPSVDKSLPAILKHCPAANLMHEGLRGVKATPSAHTHGACTATHDSNLRACMTGQGAAVAWHLNSTKTILLTLTRPCINLCGRALRSQAVNPTNQHNRRSPNNKKVPTPAVVPLLNKSESLRTMCHGFLTGFG
jgi:hypothetical protein